MPNDIVQAINKSLPYTYLIGWSVHQKYYYGVRHASGCHPDDLWKKYFTSSKKVKKLRVDLGEPDLIEVRKQFNNKELAINWEKKVLRRLNVLNNTFWLNDNIAGSVKIASEPKTEEWKNKNRKPKSTTRNYFNNKNGAGNKGIPKSDKHKQKISEAHTGMKKPWVKGGVGNKGKPKSLKHIKAVMDALNTDEVRTKKSNTWANKPIVTCPYCSKQGKEGHNMNRYHFDNCKKRIQ